MRMPIRAVPATSVRASTARVAALAVVVAAASLTGCSSSGGPEPMATVWVTQTVDPTPTGTSSPRPLLPSLPAVKTTRLEIDELPEGYYAFLMPSRRIGCMMFAGQAGETSGVATVRCDMTQANWVVQPPEGGCDGLAWGGGPDGGRALAIEGSPGRPRVQCVSDSVVRPDAPLLGYGTGVQVGALTCESRESGLRCVAAEGGGFDVSRERLVMACGIEGERVIVPNAPDPCKG